MKLVYFASVREAIGLSCEERDVPQDVRTVDDLVAWLAGHSKQHAHAFNNATRLRFALDQEMVAGDALLSAAQELAIFPPVTGG